MTREQLKYILWKLSKTNKLEINWDWYIKKQLDSFEYQGENVGIDWEFHTKEQMKEMI